MKKQARWLVVSNDDIETIIFDTKYIEVLGEFLHKSPELIRSIVSKHEHHYRAGYKKWRGDYKILKIYEEE